MDGVSIILSAVDVYDISKSSAELELTPCLGQPNDLISLFCVIMYLYDVKYVVCK